ncbi:MAG: sodium/solute symporter [Phycisphaerales bacterium]|nr:sodium/solute symporter [Phycisphaerales bacterium]MCB9863222.1 sodium/solute symporter [Phycisphaerales bacterium]
MGAIDIVVFLVLAAAVIGIGLWASRGEETHSEHGAQDYFLAGRKLTWWLVGFSLIAANISTEQFVGMSGQAADWLGMAIASYEWMAAITLVVVAFLFLPKFLKSGIYTIPEFLEYRYNSFARSVMAIVTLIILVGVPTASVIYSGAKVITGNFQGVTIGPLDFGNITLACWIIGTVAAAYVFTGGLKACAWTDLMWGSGLILGGAIIAYMAMNVLGNADAASLVATARNGVTTSAIETAGPISRFIQLNQGALPEGKLHMVREASDPAIPWTALVLGLWIPNFFYWGLNQYITQRTLGSKSLADGQKGVVFAAFLKLIIPFIVVIPGILAFNLFNDDLKEDAVNRNALVLAENAPDLYRSLSEGAKPKDEQRNQQIIASVKEKLAASEKKEPQVFTFKPEFASLHPDDAAKIAKHNAKVVSTKMTESDIAAALTADPMAITLFNDDLVKGAGSGVKVETLAAYDTDNAFPTLIRKLLPLNTGLKGFVLVAIFGAVVSSLASMLNSASTIATMDVYYKLRKGATQYELVTAGRVFVVIFVLTAMVIAPMLGHPAFGGIFTFIQEFQGFISPGILAIFLFGMLVHRAPRFAGTIGLLLNPVLYGLFKFSPDILGKSNPGLLQTVANWSFLDRMALCFGIVLAVLTLLTLIAPLQKPVDLPVNEKMDVTPSKGAMFFGALVCVATVALYIVFW